MLDLTDLATEEKWAEIVRPKSLLDACTVDGRIYCAPINIHSWQWLWLSNGAFEKAGVAVPNNWDEFVAAAPALEKAGIRQRLFQAGYIGLKRGDLGRQGFESMLVLKGHARLG